MREGDEQAARRTHGLGDLPEELEGDRRDPLAFELGCHQTDRLVAHRSDGDEQGRLHSVFDEDARAGRRCVSHQTSRRRDRSHERKMTAAHESDSPLSRQLSYSIQRKSNVGIATQAGVIEGSAPMAFDEQRDVGITRNLPKARVAATNGRIERRLAGQNKARARYQRQAAFAERLAQ